MQQHRYANLTQGLDPAFISPHMLRDSQGPQTICSISNFGPHCPVCGWSGYSLWPNNYSCWTLRTSGLLFCLGTTLPPRTSWQCCSGRWTCSPHASKVSQGFSSCTKIPWGLVGFCGLKPHVSQVFRVQSRELLKSRLSSPTSETLLARSRWA